MDMQVNKEIAILESDDVQDFESVSSAAFYFQVKALIDSQAEVSKPGYSGGISSESVLFCSNSSLAFPLRDVENIRHINRAAAGLPRAEMTVNFAGLTGTTSPLPEFYSEDVIFSSEENSPSGKFLDVFNHRLISFFYRSLEKLRNIDEYELGAGDTYSNYIFSLFGMRGRDFRLNSGIDWERLLPFALFFRNGPASPFALKKVIAHYFSLCSVTVTQFVKSDAVFRAQDLNKLGVENTSLGDNCSLGDSMPQLNQCFKLSLGGLSYRQFRNFLPDRGDLSILRKLTSILIRKPLDMQVELSVESSDVPRIVLANADIFQLGYNCWLGKPTEQQFTLRL